VPQRALGLRISNVAAGSENQPRTNAATPGMERTSINP
jgi:hypothetical protein